MKYRQKDLPAKEPAANLRMKGESDLTPMRDGEREREREEGWEREREEGWERWREREREIDRERERESV
jgi:hypothetical protein